MKKIEFDSFDSYADGVQEKAATLESMVMVRVMCMVIIYFSLLPVAHWVALVSYVALLVWFSLTRKKRVRKAFDLN